MIKITRILLLLLFCLGLIVVADLTVSSKVMSAVPPSKVTIDMPALEGQLTALEERLPALEGQLTALEERLPALKEQLTALEERLPALKGQLPATEGQLTALEERLTALERQLSELKEQLTALEGSEKGKEATSSNLGFIIAIALNLLLTIACFIILKSSIDRNAKTTNRRFENLKDNMSKDENDLGTKSNGTITIEQLQKIISDQDKILSQLSQLWQKVNTLEDTLKRMQSALYNGDFQRFNPTESPTTVNSNEELSATFADKFTQKSSAAVVPPQNDSPNRADPLRDNSYSASFRQNLQESPKIREIVSAFNKMMGEVAKAKGLESRTIRESFAEKYRVVTFKCINSEERVSNPELPPVFEPSKLTDSKLWGVPLTGDTLVVFPSPSLRNYESTMHYKGGMKELFESNYTGGNYLKIELIKPTIVTADLRTIKQKGELRLS